MGNGKLEDIRHTIVSHVPVQKAWEAVATSEGLGAWFMPNDLKPEEGYEFHLNAAQFGMSPCKVTNVDPIQAFSFQWGRDWILTFELQDLGDETQVTVIHSGWEADKVTEFGAPHSAVRANMDQGWAGLVQKLKSYLEG
jgi:uncharacterized protein YndB with AHSA1/START domain